MKRPITKRPVWIFLATVALLILGAISLHFFHHPNPPQDVVSVQCSWLGYHGVGIPITETSNPAAIARITDELSKGRFVIPLGKSMGIVGIKLTDKGGNQQGWTLDVGNDVGEWGSGKHFYVGPRLEEILREIDVALRVLRGF